MKFTKYQCPLLSAIGVRPQISECTSSKGCLYTVCDNEKERHCAQLKNSLHSLTIVKKESEAVNLKLYSHWMSSCSFRVRFALNLKGLKYHYVAITTSSKSDPEFLKLNPLALIPILVDGDFVLAESLAIIMYLDDKYPQYPLLPHDSPKRALNFQVAHIFLQNNIIEKKVGPYEKLPWAQSVIRKGFTALEKLLKDHTGRYATRDKIFLVLAIHMTMLSYYYYTMCVCMRIFILKFSCSTLCIFGGTKHLTGYGNQFLFCKITWRILIGAAVEYVIRQPIPEVVEDLCERYFGPSFEHLSHDKGYRFCFGSASIFAAVPLGMNKGMNTDTIVKAKSFLDGDEDQHEKDVFEKNLKVLQNIF
ncbi:uncharacterized protein [Arachis hypogaea]|uniref:uncharacterized protein n=1 Tax=Arachis hypogaea TaxID=3818 RepID=UPI003B216046